MRNASAVNGRALIELPFRRLDVNETGVVELEQVFLLPVGNGLLRHAAAAGELRLRHEKRRRGICHSTVTPLPVTRYPALPGFWTPALETLGAPTTRIGLEATGSPPLGAARFDWS